MKYAILIYLDEPKMFSMPKEEVTEVVGAFKAYVEALREAGAFVDSVRLEPSRSATTLRIDGGQRIVQDGPYADAKEQLASLYVVDVVDGEAALEWAARCPASPFAVLEIRPLWGQS